ncbi:hypothetical protein H8959_019068 [Pygathrix nigripes]
MGREAQRWMRLSAENREGRHCSWARNPSTRSPHMGGGGHKNPLGSMRSQDTCSGVGRSRLPGVTHVSVTAHWLPMFSRDNKPRRTHVMSLRALNLAQVPVLDWAFGHSIISCHVEQHLFPRLSDNMCLKVKPVMSQFLHEKQLPYNEDSYLARFRLFLRRYEEFMVQAPPITELGGLQ